jgi:FkbM family methyltransferase
MSMHFDSQANSLLPKKLAAKLKKLYHQLLRTKIIHLSGVALSARNPGLSRMVRNQLYRGTYENKESHLLCKYLKASDIVIEIGCGIGFIGCLCAQIAGSKNVYSFEANPELETVIKANYALNGVSPHLTMRAVTRDGKDVIFYIADNQISTSAISRDTVQTKPLTLKSVPLSQILVEIKPTVLVMDVEGLEVDLLSNSINLECVRMIIAETHPHIVGVGQINSMNAFLKKAGFHVADTCGKVLMYAR